MTPLIFTLFTPNILKRFTDHAKGVLERCEELARTHPTKTGDGLYIDAIHLLYSLFKEKGALAHIIMTTHGVKEEDILKNLEDLKYTLRIKPSPPYTYHPLKTDEQTHIFISNPLKQCLKKAVLLAGSHNHTFLGTEHLLWSILEESDVSFAPHALKDMQRHLDEILTNTNHFPQFKNVTGLHSPTPVPHAPHATIEQLRKIRRNTHKQVGIKKTASRKTEGPLAYFCRDLTKYAAKDDSPPLIGRTNEMKRLIRVLSRKTKSNPLLVGDPGIGKTAIVEGLAKKITKGETPPHLLNKKVWALDLGLLVAGTVFRGEFEARIKDLIEELKSSKDILFIDEFHTLIGAGSAQGTLDAANILKPVLSRGEVQCIGATTYEEYRKHVEKDPALERRFQPIFIQESSFEETIAILTGLKPLYESHYRIKITDGAIRSSVELSSRYIKDRYLPDKAIDLLEEASVALMGKYTNTRDSKKLKSLEVAHKKLGEEKELAITNEEYERALRLKRKERAIHEKLNNLLRSQESFLRPSLYPELSLLDIAPIVSELTGIPLNKISDEEGRLFANLEKRLSQHIIGQQHAIKKVSAVLKRARAGLNNPRRPLGSFLFLGPTGVGKTELARVLARELSPHGKEEETLIKLNMAEFTESHTISKIIGAPPGYVGYEEGSKFLERIRRNPFSIILLDEIEKANPAVYNLLLEILENGEMDASDGKKIDFKNSVVIMTSNIGTQEFTDQALVGFRGVLPSSTIEEKYTEIAERTKKELKKFMKPELVSRIDSILVFRPLDQKTVDAIVKLRLKELQNRTKEYILRFSPDVIRFLARESFNPEEGARLVRRVIEEYIEDPLADTILEGKIAAGAVRIKRENKTIRFENE